MCIRAALRKQACKTQNCVFRGNLRAMATARCDKKVGAWFLRSKACMANTTRGRAALRDFRPWRSEGLCQRSPLPCLSSADTGRNDRKPPPMHTCAASCADTHSELKARRRVCPRVCPLTCVGFHKAIEHACKHARTGETHAVLG